MDNVAETGFELAVKKTMDRNIRGAYTGDESEREGKLIPNPAGVDMNYIDEQLDRYSDGKERPNLSNHQLVQQLHNPAVARFFRPLLMPEADDDEKAA